MIGGTPPPTQAPASGRRRLFLGVALAALALLFLVAGWQLLSGGLVGSAIQLLSGPAYLLAFPLLYLEESGVPLPLPGDVFVMYVGHRVPADVRAWVAAWLGFVLCVTLGASTLYAISRRLGRRVVAGRVGSLLHLNQERMDRAEGWFDRWGLVAVIFGRHVPGGRIPITVAAGVLEMPYRHFAFGIVISAAVWAAFYLSLGVIFGSRLASILRLHKDLTYVVGPVAVLGIAAYAGFRLITWRRQRRTHREPGR